MNINIIEIKARLNGAESVTFPVKDALELVNRLEATEAELVSERHAHSTNLKKMASTIDLIRAKLKETKLKLLSEQQTRRAEGGR